MKKIYFFSKDKLQFVEIKNFRYKLAITASTAVLIISFILCGGYSFIFSITNSPRSVVKKGDVVERKDPIAITGNTGLSTGPHLHYEVEHNGIKQDPMNFIFDDVELFN